MNQSLDRNTILASAINSIAAFIAQSSSETYRPVLVGPDGRPVKSANYQYQRQSAQRKGSMKKWIPQRLMSDQQAAYDRERIVERSIDLINNDPRVKYFICPHAMQIGRFHSRSDCFLHNCVEWLSKRHHYKADLFLLHYHPPYLRFWITSLVRCYYAKAKNAFKTSINSFRDSPSSVL